MDDQQKDRIGEYELEALIGDGAQGRVYKARYAPLADHSDAVSGQSPSTALTPGEQVALKVVRITGEDERVRLKFQEQADILRRLTHTNIVAYRDCFAWHAGEWDESQCLVMELLEGETLQDRLKKSASGLPWPQVEEIFEQCLAGLIHARERGITHRDLKPSNIFLTTTGQAKLIDFDIARRDDSGQMSTAGFKGTFDYMAPDFIAINGFRGDEVSDIFSLGVCFYQSLTGTLPYEPLGDTAHIGYLNRWRDNANPQPSFRPGVFRVLSNAKAVVARCLAARRDQRYPSFAAVLEDFRKIRYRRIRHKNKDEYELLAVLGRGGFGEVFKARRVSDGQLVAVKYLFSEKQSERFVKEAKILQQYPHPNLVKYVDFMVLEGATGEKQFFLVMEFLEGMPGWTLRPRLKNEGKLEVSEAVPLFSSYLSALQFLHENARPIIHRDIKPGNLYAPVGQPEKGKIFDLGVARDVSGTVTVGGVPGTLDYMAPEFAEAGGDRGSPQSDLYALGLCLYEALAGRPVFERLPTDLNSAWLAFQDRIRTPPAITLEADAFVQFPRLKQVILTALAPAPSNRYASAADMRAELQAAIRPAALETHASGFDGVEVTMSTFAAGQAFAHKAPAPGEVTLGTRPLAPADIPAAVAAVRAAAVPLATRPGGRGKRPVALILGGGIAALLLVSGTAFFFLRTRQDGQATPVETQANADLLAPPPATVAIKPAAEVKKEPAPAAAEPQPKPVEPPPPPPASDPLYNALLSSLPTLVSSPTDWSACELAAVRLLAQEAQPWPGLDDSTKMQRLTTLRAVLAERATAYLNQSRDAALALYQADKDGTVEREHLAQLTSQTPQLKSLLAAGQAEALKRVDAARNAYAVRGTLAGLPTRIAQTESGDDLGALVTAFLKLEATPGVTLTAAQLAPVEKAFSGRFLSLSQAYAKQADAAYAADRLEEGEPARKALGSLVAATPPRFGQAELKALEGKVAANRQAAETRIRQAAALAKERSDLLGRLDALLAAVVPSANRPVTPSAAQPVLKALTAYTPEQLADPEIKAKWDSTRDACAEGLEKFISQKDPVEERAERIKAAETCLATPDAETVLGRSAGALRKLLGLQQHLCLLRLTNGSDGQITVTSTEFKRTSLASGEAREWFLPVQGENRNLSITIDTGDRYRSRIETVRLTRSGGLERTVGEQGLSGTLPAAAPSTATPPPQASGSTPAPAAAAGASGNIEITVAPKEAALQLDGQPVEAGRMAVAAGENHKISASLRGYKPIEQYYKVKPGETRKIDLLLEKEGRRSMFGF